MDWQKRNVLITGHTGFKGSWLTLLMSKLGANLSGFSLAPPTQPSMYQLLGLDKLINSTIGDINNYPEFKLCVEQTQPEIIFHLAAQPLVRESYINPLLTLQTNVIGTANCLDIARKVDSVQAIIVVTTDKCYENIEQEIAYKETDPLGGYDPYSASKACAELVTQSYARSFMSESNIRVASVRAGNVIGGGDFAKDRLIPDYFNHLRKNEALNIRYPKAVRPWQHVLEPLSGYLQLAWKLLCNDEQANEFSGAWNFGPELASCQSVEDVLQQLNALSQQELQLVYENSTTPHEAGLLMLDINKAKQKLNWQPKLDLAQALTWTQSWYQAYSNDESLLALTSQQIENYLDL